LEAALDAITVTAQSKIFVFTTPAVARSIVTKTSQIGTQAFPGSNLQGGPMGPATLIISDGVPSGQMIVCDPTQFAASGGTVQIDAGNEASIQLDSVPDSPPSVSMILTSLWQNNLVSLRAERIFAVERRRTTSVSNYFWHHLLIRS
jgi:hypothetical protein